MALLKSLTKPIALSERSGADYWARWFRADLARWEGRAGSGLENLMSAYDGMHRDRPTQGTQRNEPSVACARHPSSVLPNV